MATGPTTTSALQDSLPDIRHESRVRREQLAPTTALTDVRMLGEGMGLDWNEVTLEQLTAQNVTETTVLENEQQIEDSLFTVTPFVVGIRVRITDRTRVRVAPHVAARLGNLTQDAVERKKDEDAISTGQAATNDLGNISNPLSSGLIRSANYRITSNVTEPSPLDSSLAGVFHGFALKDIEDEMLNPNSGQLQAQINEGLAAQVFQRGYRGMVGGVRMFEDGNITISSNAAEGFVFASGPGGAIVLVQGRAPRFEIVRDEFYGGGSDILVNYDEYAFGERSSGNWLFSISHDATNPS